MKFWRHCENDAKISGTCYDKRVKYTDEDKENIRRLYSEGKGIHEITRIIGCSKRYVQFTLFPERLVQARANRDWTKYHDRKELTRMTRELRQRKKLLIQQGLIVPQRRKNEVHS